MVLRVSSLERYRVYEIVLPEPGVPEIEVQTASGAVDLHSFAYFEGLQYSTEGLLKLTWRLMDDHNSKLANREVRFAQLNFSGVTNLSVSPRDPLMPRREDQSLEHYRLVDKDRDSIRMAFEFVGGSIIEVTARDVNLTARYSVLEPSDMHDHPITQPSDGRSPFDGAHAV